MSMMQQLGGGASIIGQGEAGMTIPIGTTPCSLMEQTAVLPSSNVNHTLTSPSHHSPNPKRRDMKSTPGRKNISSHSEAATSTAASTNHMTMSTTSTITTATSTTSNTNTTRTTTTTSISASNPNDAPSCDPKKSKSLLRTYEEIQKFYVQERKWFHEGMPLNPYPTLDALVDALNKWAQSRITSGGRGFAIIKDTSNDSSGKRGKTRKLLCDRAGFPRSPKPDTTVDPNKKTRKRKQSKKIGCPWSIYVEEIDVGWVVTYPTEQAIKAATANPKSNGCLSHNHELILSQTESLLNPNTPDMHDTAVLLQKFAPVSEQNI